MKRVAALRWWVSLFLFLSLGVGCGSDDEPATAPVEPLSTAQLLRAGSYGVGYVETTLEDRMRPTMPNRSFPGSPSRTLPAAIWYPSAQVAVPALEQRDAPFAERAAPAPLIVYSHGFLGNRRGGAYLARHLASHGYVVAAMDFPLSSFNAPGGATLGDLANQPGDVRFVIDNILEPSIPALQRFAGRVDSKRIGAMGLSLGGATTLLVSFHPTLRDPRIRAALAYAPPACFFGRAFYATAAVPLGIVHGDIDAIVPYEANGLFAFRQAQPPKYLFALQAGNHTAFTDGAETLFGQMANADDLGCAALGSALGNDSGAATFPESLGGAAAGIIAGRCPLPCALGTRNPPAVRPGRQHELALAVALAHFEAWLGGNAAARAWPEERAQAENADLVVMWQR